MIQLIIGEKGNGKTKVLLEKVNTDIKTAAGTVDYIDKSKQHMYELNNKIRLIDLTDFPVTNTDSFIGFLCGIISQDRDLEKVYLDSFLKIARVEPENIGPVLDQISRISETFKVDFVISVSITRPFVPEHLTDSIFAEL